MRIILILVLVVPGLFASCSKSVHEGPKELKIEDRIFDYAGLLSHHEKDSLFQLIKGLEDRVGSQIAIVIIDSLDGQSIERYSIKMAETLRLGRAKFDDGILITVVLRDRRMRIEVGMGLEKIIKDEIAGRINREEMAPGFRRGKYATGLGNAIQKISELIEQNKELVGERP